MTIAEVKLAKEALEHGIQNLIVKFCEDTYVSVSRIYLDRIQVEGIGRDIQTVGYKVSVTAEV